MSARKLPFGEQSGSASVCREVLVDRAISQLLLELMQPMTLQVALAVQQEVEARVTDN